MKAGDDAEIRPSRLLVQQLSGNARPSRAYGILFRETVATVGPQPSSTSAIFSFPPIMNDQLLAGGGYDDSASGSPKRKKIRAKYAPKAW